MTTEECRTRALELEALSVVAKDSDVTCKEWRTVIALNSMLTLAVLERLDLIATRLRDIRDQTRA